MVVTEWSIAEPRCLPAYTDSRAEEDAIIERCIRTLAAGGRSLDILEAGCGRRWPLRLDGLTYRLTGVDTDRAALDIRRDTVGDLDEVVVGDLRTVVLRQAAFDVVYCSYVLEHVRDAEGVMARFVRWLRPGGLLVLKVPDRRSVQGFVTRWTPHWVHVFYYRRVLGARTAGLPGYEPYPVVYDPVVSRSGIRRFCREQGLSLVAEYADGYYRPGRPGLRGLLHGFKKAVALLSLGRLHAGHNNLLFILRKR